MRATFIPSFFPKPPASTLAVSCKRLRESLGEAYFARQGLYRAAQCGAAVMRERHTEMRSC